MTVEWHSRYQRDPGAILQLSRAADRRICSCLGREQREGRPWPNTQQGSQHACELWTGRLRRGRNRRRRRRDAHVDPDGARVRAMQERVAALFAKRHGIMVNSGSSANYLAVELLDLPKGAEVITPALTFATTVAPIVRAGLVPVFVDAAEGDLQHRRRRRSSAPSSHENAGHDDPVADRQPAGLGPHSRDCRQASPEGHRRQRRHARRDAARDAAPAPGPTSAPRASTART